MSPRRSPEAPCSLVTALAVALAVVVPVKRSRLVHNGGTR